MKKILVGTMYSGENEFDECMSALKNQDYRSWDQFILKGLPNKEAHERLYERFMSETGNYDLFLKLDADMILMDESVLSRIVDLFKGSRNLDHGEFAVNDWYSDSLIMGVHVTTNRAFWEKTGDELFVDPYPRIPGKRLRIWNGIAPFVRHSPNPSPFQAYHFGVHRALKTFQFSSEDFNNTQSKYQWEILRKAWSNFCRSKDRRLGLTVLGAEHVINKYAVNVDCDYTNEALMNKFASFENLNRQCLHRMLRVKWNTLYSPSRRYLILRSN